MLVNMSVLMTLSNGVGASTNGSTNMKHAQLRNTHNVGALCLVSHGDPSPDVHEAE